LETVCCGYGKCEEFSVTGLDSGREGLKTNLPDEEENQSALEIQWYAAREQLSTLAALLKATWPIKYINRFSWERILRTTCLDS